VDQTGQQEHLVCSVFISSGWRARPRCTCAHDPDAECRTDGAKPMISQRPGQQRDVVIFLLLVWQSELKLFEKEVSAFRAPGDVHQGRIMKMKACSMIRIIRMWNSSHAVPATTCPIAMKTPVAFIAANRQSSGDQEEQQFAGVHVAEQPHAERPPSGRYSMM